MRQAIYDYISNIGKSTMGTFALASELPYDSSGVPLYLKNFKRIYIDIDQVSQEPVFDAMNAAGAVDEITIVRAYFVTDAKQLSSNYEDLVQAIKDARLTQDIPGVIRRLCQVSTKFQDDALITEFEFSFRKLLTN